jgi:uncharacterized protein (DUF2147 family)
MRRFLIGLSGLAVALAPAPALAKSGLEGRWKNGAMEILIAPCGKSLCGRVVKASAKQQAKSQSGSGTRLLGARVIDNIQPVGPGKWNADVFVASRDVNASGTIQQVGPNRLMVRGCVLAVICKTTHWDRIA